jgi:hypothetical protein
LTISLSHGATAKAISLTLTLPTELEMELSQEVKPDEMVGKGGRLKLEENDPDTYNQNIQ